MIWMEVCIVSQSSSSGYARKSLSKSEAWVLAPSLDWKVLKKPPTILSLLTSLAEACGRERTGTSVLRLIERISHYMETGGPRYITSTDLQGQTIYLDSETALIELDHFKPGTIITFVYDYNR
jgi:hypothetical protein